MHVWWLQQKHIQLISNLWAVFNGLLFNISSLMEGIGTGNRIFTSGFHLFWLWSISARFQRSLTSSWPQWAYWPLLKARPFEIHLCGRHMSSQDGSSLTILTYSSCCHSPRRFAFSESGHVLGRYPKMPWGFWPLFKYDPSIPFAKTPLALSVKVKHCWVKERHTLSNHEDKPSKHS